MRFPLRLTTLLCTSLFCLAVSADELEQIHETLAAIKRDYELRIGELERRLDIAESRIVKTASRTEQIANRASDALEIAEEAALAPLPMTRSANTFNPAIGLVMVGTAGSPSGNQEYAVPGFSLPEEGGPTAEGFALGESELNINTNVDDKFFGNVTFALASEDGDTEIELEEAYIQTLAIPWGVALTAGRFFSGIGYLNGFHTHADDFADRPLSYSVFLGGQYKDDGIQLRWLLPTPGFVEIGAEWLRGEAFPAAGAARDGRGAWSLFIESGGDVGFSHSWKAGLGLLRATVVDRAVNPADENSALFSGESDLYNLNFVWKWAPGGNPVSTNFKLQGEYFFRQEDGTLDAAIYEGDQTGWYLQGNWQFRPQWSFGYRYGQVDADNDISTGPLAAGRSSERNSLMLAWQNSEFSRIKLQFADRSGSINKNQWVLQYIHSLGAHGAHQF